VNRPYQRREADAGVPAEAGLGEDRRKADGVDADPALAARVGAAEAVYRELPGGTRIILVYACVCYSLFMTRIGVSLPSDLVEFADREAKRLKTSRSGLLARLLQAERIRGQVRRYVDEHGWDVVEDEGSWRAYQSRRMAEEYGGDDW